MTENWTELTDEELSGHEYQNAEAGWRNTETDAEVIVYRTEGTGMADVTEKDWAVQHPFDEDTDDNVEFFDDRDAAVAFAEEYIDDHAEPPNAY